MAGLHRDTPFHLYALAMGQRMDDGLIAALDRISDAIIAKSGGAELLTDGASSLKHFAETAAARFSGKGAALESLVAGKSAAMAAQVADNGTALESLVADKGAVLESLVAGKGAALAAQVADNGAALESLMAEKGAALAAQVADKGAVLESLVAGKGAALGALGDTASVRAALSKIVDPGELLAGATGSPFDLVTWSFLRVFHATATFVRLTLSPPRPTR